MLPIVCLKKGEDAGLYAKCGCRNVEALSERLGQPERRLSKQVSKGIGVAAFTWSDKDGAAYFIG